MNKATTAPELEMQFAGTNIEQLARRAGRTPFFAYDRAAINARVHMLRAYLPAAVHLHYSIKANPMPAVVHHLATQVDGFDVASAAEMSVALDAGARPADIGFAGPGKSREDLRRALACGVNIHIESASQLALVTALGTELGVQPSVAIRVNPDFHVAHSGMRMGGGATPFGVDVEQVPALLRELAAREIALAGFHVFWGSQCLHAPTIIHAQQQSAALIMRLASHLQAPPQFVNLGGGFGIPYFAGEMPLTLDAVSAAMHEWLARFHATLPQTRVILELGRYLVGEAGIYVCRVLERKVSAGKTFLVTDGGLHHHLAASGNFGQVLRRNFPIALSGHARAAPLERCQVVGCLCTPLDRLGDDVMLPHAAEGDFVVIKHSGAYGRTASPLQFLSHPEPVEMLV